MCAQVLLYPIVRLAFYDSWVTRGGKSLPITYYVLCFGSNRTKTQHVITYSKSYSRYVGLHIFSGTATKIVSSRTFLSSLHFFCIGALLFSSFPFAMNINPGMAAPLAFKHLGDLYMNTPAVRELLTAILTVVVYV